MLRRQMMNDHLTTVTGNHLVLPDCKGSRFSNFNMFGHSDQVTTTGSQLFDISTATPASGGSVVDDHTIRVVNVNTQIIDPTTSLSSHLKAGYTYHISAVAKKVAEPPNVADLMIGNNTKGFIVRVEQTNEDGTVKSVNLPEIRDYTHLNINDAVKVSGNFTVPDTYTGKASLFLHASNHKDDSDNRYFDTIDYIDIMISEGTKDKPWEPYTGGKPSPSPEYPQEIRSVGDGGNIELKSMGHNLVNVHNVINQSSGITVDQEDWITVDIDNTQGTSTKYSIFSLGTSDLLKEGKKYLAVVEIKNDCSFSDMQEIISNYIESSSLGNRTGQFSTNFLLLKNAHSKKGVYTQVITARESFENCFSMTRTVFRAMPGEKTHIELRITITENLDIKQESFVYKPYREQSLTIPLSEPLRQVYISLKDMYIRDRICRKDGVWGIERWCFKLVLGASTHWGAYSYTNKQGIIEYYGFTSHDTAPLPHSSRRAGFSNIYSVVEKGTREHMEIWLGVDSNSIFVVGVPQWDKSLPDRGVENWMKFLSEHPLEIVSYLDDPIFEPFADDIQIALNSMHTYASETSYISNSENSEMMIIYRQLNNRKG